MKFRRVALALASAALFAASAGAEEPKAQLTQKEKMSYGIGMNIAKALRGDGIEVDIEYLVRGVRDLYTNGKVLLTDDEHREALEAAQKELTEKQAEAVKKVGEKNRKEGEAFLAENRKKEGVVTLPSGLQYKVMKSGDGKTPTRNNVVETHYRGRLIDNTEFDSSYKRNRTATFPVGALIAGWTEALQLMKVGEKWELYVPSELAYGEKGKPPTVGPNTTLIFELELISIK